MVNKALSKRRLLLMTLSLTYIAIGMLGLPMTLANRAQLSGQTDQLMGDRISWK